MFKLDQDNEHRLEEIKLLYKKLNRPYSSIILRFNLLVNDNYTLQYTKQKDNFIYIYTPYIIKNEWSISLSILLSELYYYDTHFVMNNKSPTDFLKAIDFQGSEVSFKGSKLYNHDLDNLKYKVYRKIITNLSNMCEEEVRKFYNIMGKDFSDSSDSYKFIHGLHIGYCDLSDVALSYRLFKDANSLIKHFGLKYEGSNYEIK